MQFGRSAPSFQRTLPPLSSATKMMTEGFSGMLVPIYKSRWNHNPEDHNHDTHCYEALKSHYEPTFKLIFVQFCKHTEVNESFLMSFWFQFSCFTVDKFHTHHILTLLSTASAMHANTQSLSLLLTASTANISCFGSSSSRIIMYVSVKTPFGSWKVNCRWMLSFQYPL